MTILSTLETWQRKRIPLEADAAVAGSQYRRMFALGRMVTLHEKMAAALMRLGFPRDGYSIPSAIALVRSADSLSRVGWQFLYWLLTDQAANPGIRHPLVKDAVEQCAELMGRLARGDTVTREAVEAVEAAAETAMAAAETAEWAARAAAAWTAMAAAARAAARADTAAAARAAARADTAAWILMSQKLLSLLEAA